MYVMRTDNQSQTGSAHKECDLVISPKWTRSSILSYNNIRYEIPFFRSLDPNVDQDESVTMYVVMRTDDQSQTGSTQRM